MAILRSIGRLVTLIMIILF